MDRENFWQAVRGFTDYMIDKHEALTDEFGQDSAEDELTKALEIQGAHMSVLGSFPRETMLNLMVQHAALAVLCSYLDLVACDVEGIEVEEFKNPGTNPLRFK